MKVFTIIVTYNGSQWLDKCLGSLESSSIATEVIVVDNGSSDGTVDRIKASFPGCTLVISEENLGFGRANNLGISLALKQDADYIFLLNQDAWVETETLETLLRVAQNTQGYGVLSPIHLNGSGDALDYLFATYIAPPACEGLLSDLYMGNDLQTVYPSTSGNAAAWLISKATLLQVGGFDPIFFHYGEDDNYRKRLAYHNLKLGMVPAARIYHDREQRKFTHLRDVSINTNRRELLKQYADVTVAADSLYRRDLFLRLRTIIFDLILLRWWRLKEDINQYNYLREIGDKCLRSWNRNRLVGPHYLDI